MAFNTFIMWCNRYHYLVPEQDELIHECIHLCDYHLDQKLELSITLEGSLLLLFQL